MTSTKPPENLRVPALAAIDRGTAAAAEMQFLKSVFAALTATLDPPDPNAAVRPALPRQS